MSRVIHPLSSVVCGLILAWSVPPGFAEDDLAAPRILESCGVQGGLVIHLPCGDGRLTAALGADEGYVVRGLDANPANVEKARKHTQSRGQYGRVSVDSFDGKRLPLIGNLANLVVAESLGQVPLEEVMRVLAPGGTLCLKDEGDWATTVKPWPDNIDEWTHFQHGPDNNAVAEDDVVGPPRRMQWLAGPTWTRHHHADKGTDPTIRAVVSSKGRLFYTIDETESSNQRVPANWFLAARDAFSGVLLWKVPLHTTKFDRRLERVWRELIADGDEVYAQLGADRPLSALDAATGTVIRKYEGSEDLHEVIKYEDRLLVVTRQNVLLAFDAVTGKQVWSWGSGDDGPIVPLTLAADEDRVFVRTDESVRCLSIDDGKTLWQFVPEGAGKRTKLKWPREKLLVQDGVVLSSYGGKDPAVLNKDTYEYLGSHPRVHDYGARLAALSATDGALLWTTEYLPGLESMPGEIYVSGGLVWLGPDFSSPRDLHSGEVKWTRPLLNDLWTAGHHYRCYPGKATSNYILTAKRGIEMFDLTGEDHTRNNWVRGTCRMGVTPCNGLIYAPPHSCGCYMEAKLYGFWALAPGDERQGRAIGTDDDKRLREGPAYGNLQPPASSLQSPSAWPTYRGDPARSGSTDSSIPATLHQRWRTELGGRLSATTVADGKLFVAQIDAHTVHALDVATGESLWQFTAGGRIDSPPTIHAGLALFGSRDGNVYCLRASDGKLVWQFQAAPQATSAVACDQVESLWPVHGSVLVHEGIAYVAAGRSTYLDGGIALYGLVPSTGRIVAKTLLSSQHAEVMTPPSSEKREEMEDLFSQNHTDYKTFLAPDKSDAFSMAGALTDIMVADGESIFMRQLRFDRDLSEQTEKHPHLFSTSSLLDDREHNRAYWAFGTADFSRLPVAYPWIVSKNMAVPYGVMLACDNETVWGVRRKGKTFDYETFAAPRPDPAKESSLLPDFAERSGKMKPPEERWVADTSIRPRAIIRAGDKLALGGMSNRFDPKSPDAPMNLTYAGKGPGLLQLVTAANGAIVSERQLEAPPVWDGLTVAHNWLFIANRAGAIVCLGGE